MPCKEEMLVFISAHSFSNLDTRSSRLVRRSSKSVSVVHDTRQMIAEIPAIRIVLKCFTISVVVLFQS